MYLMTCTRPDLAYPLSLLVRYVAPGRHRKVHWDAAKRVLRYFCSTSGTGLVLGGRGPVVLTGHADASGVDDPATQRSSQGYTFSLGSGSFSWRSTRSSSVLSSSCEAEIYTGAMAAQELRLLTYLLTDLGEQPRSPPNLYLRLAYVATRANTADIFTKALPLGDHQHFSTVLGLLALLFLTGLVTTLPPVPPAPVPPTPKVPPAPPLPAYPVAPPARIAPPASAAPASPVRAPPGPAAPAPRVPPAPVPPALVAPPTPLAPAVPLGLVVPAPPAPVAPLGLVAPAPLAPGAPLVPPAPSAPPAPPAVPLVPPAPAVLPDSAPPVAAPQELAPTVAAPPEPAPPVAAPLVAAPPEPAPSVSAPPGSAPAVSALECTAASCGGDEDGRGGKPGGVSKCGKWRVAAVSSAAGSSPSAGSEESEEICYGSTKGAALAVVLERQMAALRIEEDEAVEEGVQKFFDLLTRLEGADLNYSELQKKTKLLALLPESWSSLIINLNRDLPRLSLEDVKRAILQEDFCCRELASADGAGAASIGRGYGRGRGRGRGGGRFPGQFFFVSTQTPAGPKKDEGIEEPAAVGNVTLHSLDYWVIDSGATYSMTPRADLLTELEPSPVKHVTSSLGQRAEVKGMGKAMFKGADGKMVGLKNVLWVPNLAANLISVRWLQKAGMDTSSKGAKTYIARLGKPILWDLHEDRDVYNEMWQIPVVPMPKERQVAASISTKGEAVGSGDGANGRAKEIKSKKCNLGGTSKLGEHEESGAAAQKVKNEMVAGIRVKGEPDEVLGCPTCMQAKFIRYPFSSSEATAKAPLDEVMMDVVGPLKLGAAGAEYFLTIVDVYTCMTWVYVLSKKSEWLKRGNKTG
ncbi:unnamed protein product [Closterium sp. NIES-53]